MKSESKEIKELRLKVHRLTRAGKLDQRAVIIRQMYKLINSKRSA